MRKLLAVVAAGLIALGTLVPIGTLSVSISLVIRPWEAGAPGPTYGPSTGDTALGASPVFRWTQQFGTSAFDEIHGVAVNGSSLYVAGSTGNPPDAFLRRYALDGSLVWTRQFGTGGEDFTQALAINASSVYVAGYVRPPNDAGFNADAFLTKYDSDGNFGWTRQFGTLDIDYATSIVADGSGAYLGGLTFGTLPGETGPGGTDAFVRKYDPDGNIVWTRQFGTVGWDGVTALALGPLGLFVAGATSGEFPGNANPEGTQDGFLRKCDLDGSALWTRQFGSSSSDAALGVAVNGSGVYVGGVESVDASLRKYDLDGNLVWTRSFGTHDGGFTSAVTANGFGVYVAGHTQGTLPGETRVGGYDAYVRKYDSAGVVVWTHQFGTPSNEIAWAAGAGESSVYVGGYTEGSFPDQTNAGSYDAFLVALDALPPTIAVTSPPDGSTFRSAGLTVVGTASDDVGVRNVEVSADRTTWVLASGTTSWSAELTLQEGSNTILARATDAAGNVGVTTIVVKVVIELLLVFGLAMGIAILGVVVVPAIYILRRRKRGSPHLPTDRPPPGQKPL